MLRRSSRITFSRKPALFLHGVLVSRKTQYHESAAGARVLRRGKAYRASRPPLGVERTAPGAGVLLPVTI
jgi:hypothetical protein